MAKNPGRRSERLKRKRFHHEGREEHEGKNGSYCKEHEKYFFVTFVRFVVGKCFVGRWSATECSQKICASRENLRVL
jgi:hypothetical protein